ncbi:TetR family transcriptional regulator [Actinoplanes sp. N902-109]|uniref:TetR family transcriptional regulator n=1 Tax=Actinoplanes sp. (strain N902-109) TaxID=649831 RepID=UPI0003293EC2|nr:TetR family transcriptional regulator [Actinoplanes sp. N902-109]AGL17369.1 TetR family transcriptional regulator [Actinoplanes sp. N902-109]
MTEGLRERKKREMRRRLSDTAAQLFLRHGFDAFRVADVAEACGVSEKTVFNYFPTKESLVLDQLETTMSALRTGLADASVPPVRAALRILGAELTAITGGVAASGDPVSAIAGYRRFGELLAATPSLRAYQSDTMDRFVTVAAQLLAERIGSHPDDPEPQIAAAALLGLWRVQFQSLRRHLATTSDPGELHDEVTADVHRAARLIENGLTSAWPS